MVSRIQRYWGRFLDMNPEILDQSGIHIIANGGRLKDFNGSWIFNHKKVSIISIPPEWIKPIKIKIQQTTKVELSPSFVQFLFEDQIDKIIGPTFQGYADMPSLFETAPEIISLNWTKDQEIIRSIASFDDIEWQHSSIDERSLSIYGFMDAGDCIAIANYKRMLDLGGFIGVYTKPEFRKRGYGKEVVKRVLNDIYIGGDVPVYQTLMENTPSLGIAKGLGINEFAQNIAVRLKNKP